MPNSIVKSFAKRSGKSVDEVEDLWKKAEKLAVKKGITQQAKNFFAYTTGILKRMLKLESLLQEPEDMLESYLDGTPHRIRSEPRDAASTIFKRDKFLRRRNEKDKKKVISGKHKSKKSKDDSKGEDK